jgi:hypothetical protein
MAMIGARPTPSLGGVPLSLGVSPTTMLAAPPSAVPDMPTFAQPPKPKTNWMGILADALSGLAGNGPIYAPIAERRREEQSAFERGEEMYQRRRQDQQTDTDNAYQHQIQLFDYKRQHPDDALTQAMDAAGITDPAERQNYYRANVDRMTAPPMMSAPGVDEQGNPVMRFFPRAPAASPGAPAVGTVQGGYRFKGGNPSDPSAWEQVGGPTQPASGTFR